MNGTCTAMFWTRRFVMVAIGTCMGRMSLLHEMRGILKEFSYGRDQCPE